MKKIFIAIFFAVSCMSWAQKQLEDSLLLRLESATMEQKPGVLVELSNATVYSETRMALQYAEEAYAIARRNKQDSIKYEALRAMGYAHGYLGNFDTSLKNMKDGLSYYKQEKDSINIAKSLSDIAYLMEFTGNSSDSVMSANLEALAIREKMNDTKGIVYSLNNIGAYLWKWGQKEDALAYFFKALPLSETLHLKEETAQCSFNIGSYYFEKDSLELAEEYLNKALKIFIEINHKMGETSILIKKANIAFSQNQSRQALRHLEEAKTLSETLGNPESISSCDYNIASILFKEKLYTQAYSIVLEAEETARKYNFGSDLSLILNLKADILERLGEYQEAFNYLREAKHLQDSLYSLEQYKKQEELRTKYEAKKVEAENQRLSLENQNHELKIKRNRTITLLGSSSSFLLIIIFIYYFKHKQAQANLQNTLTEQRLLRAQMNPHFIFNAISAIQHDVLKKSPQESVLNLSRFASLIRQFLESSRKDWIALNKEVKLQDNYLKIQQLRYSNKFDFDIYVAHELEETEVLIPPLLCQPIIENAIEHGIKSLTSGGVIAIRFLLKSKDIIIIEVEDNGVGINKQVRSINHQSYALESIKTRLSILHQKAKTTYLFETIDKAERSVKENGTLVRFSVPFKNEF